MDGMAAGPFPIARRYSSGMRGRPIAKIGLDGSSKLPSDSRIAVATEGLFTISFSPRGGTDRAWSGHAADAARLMLADGESVED